MTRTVSPAPLQALLDLSCQLAREQGRIMRFEVDRWSFGALGGWPDETLIQIATPSGYVEIRKV